MKLPNLTITQAHQGLIEKQFSAVELTKAYLDRIKRVDKKISAFLSLTEDIALKQAEEVDCLISQRKEISVLAGLPMVVKDNILVKGAKCTAGSKILENYISPYNATVIKKLKSQGAVILGKANLDEFAMGSSGENSAFAKTKNPLDLALVPGGSSSGPASAVAANECIYSLGSDTGGSIRLPACFCGVVGLKPTYGAVSRYGLIAMASSLDQIGPITKTVEDAKIVFDAIKGRDPLDSTSIETGCGKGLRSSYREELSVKRKKTLNVTAKRNEHRNRQTLNDLKIGIPKEYFIKGVDAAVEREIKKAIKKIESLGVKVEEISLPHTKYALAVYYIIMCSEVSANLARYDGIRFGRVEKSSKVKTLIDIYLQTRGEKLGKEVRRRIMLGTYALSSGYYEAYYLRAQKVRSLIKRDFDEAFKKVDLILTPTSPTLPFKLGEKITNPLTMYLSDIFTVSANLAGIPALSVPISKINNLSVGIQLMGKPFEEDKIFEPGKIIEKDNYDY